MDSGSALEEAFEAARAAWPGVDVPRDRFEASVRERGLAGPELHATDLYLALACATGDARGIAAFERAFAGDVLRALGRLRIAGPAAEELQQRVRHKLFVPQGENPPKIATYSARGPLRGWLRALVVHEALGEQRKHKREDPDADARLSELATDDDPELAHVKARYAGPFREAFRDALAGLSPRDRNVLRLAYTDGLTVEQVALMYGVHRVSVSRWLGQTRRDLFERTRALLRDRLNLDESELRSLTRLCLSQIDVSLDRLLSR